MFIKKLLPKKIEKAGKFIVYAFRYLPEVMYWYKWDLKQSSLFGNKTSHLAGLMVASHVLEKGITMPERRLGFGYDRVRSLIKSCKSAIDQYTENHIEIQSTIKDLEQYLDLHKEEGFALPNDIVDDINSLLKYKLTDTVPCYEATPSEFFKPATTFYELAHQRHTVRWYSDKPVEKELLLKAISLAQTAPSACNRQSTKVYIVETDEKKKQVLQLQNGNRGFGHRADKILLITSNMKYWHYTSRTSAYLDGGIFTQNLLYALHYYKICACTMNSSMSPRNKEELRKVVGFSESEIPIVFIAIGSAPEHFMIAGSQRLNKEKIYTFI